jgi:hypothetical protein
MEDNESFSSIISNLNRHKHLLNARSRNALDEILGYKPTEIQRYLVDRSSLKLIRNIGKKTLQELFEYFDTVLTVENLNFLQTCVENKDEAAQLVISEYDYFIEWLGANDQSGLKLKLIEEFTNQELTVLNVRANNAIKSILDLGFLYFLRYAYDSSKILDIQNVGKITELQIIEFFNKIVGFIDWLINNSNKPNFTEEIELLKIYFKSNETISLFIAGSKHRIIDRRFQLYCFYSLLLTDWLFHDPDDLYVFKKRHGLFKNEMSTLEEIGLELGLTRERIRQIAKKHNERIESAFYNIAHLWRLIKEHTDTRYQELFSKNLIIVNLDFVEVINSIEACDFCLADVQFITRLILIEQFKTIDYTVDRQKNYFLIRNEIADDYDFLGFLEAVSRLVNKRRKDKLELNLEGFVYKYFIGKKLENFDEIVSICEELILQIYELVINPEGNIIFLQNTGFMKSYIINVLKESNRALKVDEIYFKLSRRFPEDKISDQKIRKCLNENNEFEAVSKTSTYILKEWERSRVGMKGGTIKDIVYDFLVKSKKQKHMDEVCNHVAKYRENVSKRSLRTNLKLDKEKRFTFIGNHIITLNHH